VAVPAVFRLLNICVSSLSCSYRFVSSVAAISSEAIWVERWMWVCCSWLYSSVFAVDTLL